MKPGIALARLMATHAFPPKDLARFAALTAAASPDVAALRAEIARLFDELDVRDPKNPADVAAMELLAEAADNIVPVAAGAAPATPHTPLPTMAEINARKRRARAFRLPSAVAAPWPTAAATHSPSLGSWPTRSPTCGATSVRCATVAR